MNDFEKYFNNIKFDENEKKLLTEKLIENIENNKTKNSKKVFKVKKIKFIAIASIMIVLLTGISYASELIRNVIKENINGSETALSKFSKNISYVGITKKSDDWSITITDITGDKSNLLLGIEIKSPKNIKFNNEREYSFEDLDVKFKNNIIESYSLGHAITNLKIIDENTLTGILDFNIFTNDKNSNIKDEIMNINLSGFTDNIFNSEKQIFEPSEELKKVNKKSWKFKNIKLDYDDTSIIINPNDEVEIFKEKAILKSIKISPLSIEVKIEGEATENHHRKPSSRPEAYKDNPFINENMLKGLERNDFCEDELNLKMIDKNGISIDVSDNSGSSCEDKPGFSYMKIIGNTEEVIDISNIDYIEICGKKYYLSDYIK